MEHWVLLLSLEYPLSHALHGLVAPANPVSVTGEPATPPSCSHRSVTTLTFVPTTGKLLSLPFSLSGPPPLLVGTLATGIRTVALALTSHPVRLAAKLAEPLLWCYSNPPTEKRLKLLTVQNGNAHLLLLPSTRRP